MLRNSMALSVYIHFSILYSVHALCPQCITTVAQLQANLDSASPPSSWPLDSLAAKMKQYCYLMEDLTGDLLKEHAATFEDLRKYLQKRAVDAYWEKVISTLSAHRYI